MKLMMSILISIFAFNLANAQELTIRDLYLSYQAHVGFNKTDIEIKGHSQYFSALNVQKLPSVVVATFIDLGVSVYDGEPVLEVGHAQGTNKDYEDTFVNQAQDAFIVRSGNKVLGYAFSLTTCTEDECYPETVLFLDAKGKLVK
ncbi:MAG: hypothetical protein ACLGGX_05655 [Bdellovibrionia bacterium]